MTTIATPAPGSTAVSEVVASRPRLRRRLSIARGNVLQAAGIAAGASLLAVAAANVAPTGVRFALALLGWLAIYDCTHSVAHYLAGRTVGIRFRFYGIRGTDHPEDYPIGLRQLMSVAPFWSIVTDQASMRTTAPWRKAAMFASGETSTAVCSILAGYMAAVSHVPGGTKLLGFSLIWNAVSTVVTAIKPKGDYAKAVRALRTPR